MIDHSMAEGAPGREFLCRCVLLFWYFLTLVHVTTGCYTGCHTGCYTGCDIRRCSRYLTPLPQDRRLPRARGGLGGYMVHQGKKACHWCEGCWPSNKAYRCCVFGGHHRWLNRGNPLRQGDGELAPAERTLDSISRDAQASVDSDLPWDDSTHPRAASGVNGPSALSLLPMFNIVWDVMPDWMHIIKNLMLGHFIKVIKGDRKLKPLHYSFPADGATPAEIAAVTRSCSAAAPYYLGRTRMYHVTPDVTSGCVLTNSDINPARMCI